MELEYPNRSISVIYLSQGRNTFTKCMEIVRTDWTTSQTVGPCTVSVQLHCNPNCHTTMFCQHHTSTHLTI
ncbi:hypothetical protein AQUCO_03600036v1 [Aquilegia coerulea]|uniref:Uncharacterized protein n=1 Tax=Aquilegia coerulea TaxID=218851 RepID=A0A2G5CUZ1_AQUCA|nr:hypothetical protein AQUCO_03600036v1 [Aquilegia coerulea]